MIKKIILTCFALLLIGCSFFIYLHGGLNNEKTASYKNIKTSVDQLLTQFKDKKTSSSEQFSPSSEDTLLLLLSETNNNSIFVQAWKNIALEEGLHLSTMLDSDFLSLIANNYQGIILADTIHKDITPELSKKLMDYVASGGFLMLVYDAGTLNQNNSSSKRYPLMAELLGINCGNEDILKGCISETSPIGNTVKGLSALGVPPGKCMLANEADSNSKVEDFCAISSSELGILQYTHYLIPISDNTPPLLTTSDHQLIAAVKTFGKGRILYVNLPLTYLWAQTDAMFLHAFLHYFASNMLQLPVLAAVPNGIGGIILNLHVESIDALVGLNILQKRGLFQQGPYSIDFTAGPGLNQEDDRLGLNVPQNKQTQAWIQYLARLGHAIGSDGGWMHNYFGTHANESNQNEFEYYIKINNEAIETLLGRKVLEYVPSMGNQPSWAIRYLEKQGFLGYYSTANTGNAPTQHFSKGVFDKEQLWSFPVLPFKYGACFRDFGRIGYSVPSVSQWLLDSTRFVSSRNTSRLIYFHPPDILFFPQYLSSLRSWLSLTQQLQFQGKFQWYSMVELAEFLNKRRQVSWTVRNWKNIQFIKAMHPDNLKTQAWLLFKKKCAKPQINKGIATIKESKNHWIVQAGNVQELEFSCQIISP
jgi:hypothetical protein